MGYPTVYTNRRKGTPSLCCYLLNSLKVNPYTHIAQRSGSTTLISRGFYTVPKVSKPPGAPALLPVPHKTRDFLVLSTTLETCFALNTHRNDARLTNPGKS